MRQGRKPYEPHLQGPQVHDRRARQISRGQTGHIVEVEVDDPYEAGAKISAVRSIRDDPLAWHRSRNHIDQAQYEAGRAFQKAFAEAERGPTAIPLAEAVDGGLPAETLTDRQLKAGKILSRCYSVLGQEGSALMNDLLVHNRTTRQIAESRGFVGVMWERYYARRLWGCLNTLAVVFGLSNGM